MNKSKIFTLILLLIFGYIVWKESGKSNPLRQVELQGATMGTVYHIKYLDAEARNFQTGIDSLLEVFNQSLNHYLPDAEISQFNRQDSFRFVLPYFYPVLQKSEEVYQKTKGAFDPTVAPLINAWGFGPEGGQLPDSLQVDSLLQLVGFHHIRFTENYVVKDTPHVQLNFSAIAKGYGIDVVAVYLQQQGIQHMMVEIGGEVRCQGVNQVGEPWRIGIDSPVEEGDMMATVAVKDKALATSGNYRNYYIKDGKKYTHTINPQTGYPVQHNLLSATVFANDCMTADAYATAFMVLGLEESKKILNQEGSLDAYLIFDDGNGGLSSYRTPGIADAITEL
jgi:thiamine biosynthesis lipoprotein